MKGIYSTPDNKGEYTIQGEFFIDEYGRVTYKSRSGEIMSSTDFAIIFGTWYYDKDMKMVSVSNPEAYIRGLPRRFASFSQVEIEE